MALPTALHDLLHRARQRYLCNVVLEQACWAASASFAGAVLLLIFGTQILDWYWPVLLFVGGFLFGLMRIRKGLPAVYDFAQHLDRKLGLPDSLSTAYYFHSAGDPPRPGLQILDAQLTRSLEQDVDVKKAVPLIMPRSSYVAVALGATLVLMLGVRYGITRSLSLQKPIAQISFDLFAEPPAVEASSKKSVIQERFEEQLKQMGLSLEQLESPRGEQKDAGEQIGTLPTPSTSSPVTNPEQGEEGTVAANLETGSEHPESVEGGESNGRGDRQSAENGVKGAGEPGKPENAQAQGNENSGENASLSNKLRDAVANLLAKMRAPKGAGQNQPSAQSPGDSSARSQLSKNQNGTQGQSKSKAEGQGADQDSGDAGEQGEKMQAGQSKQGQSQGEGSGGPDAKSGIGKQDGSKDLKEAEQLAAMGKISELIGKRSAQISGEMTVEVPGGKQQLRTSYSQRKALHADAGGEAGRDEVPLIHQPYVQRYFEEIRKSETRAR